MIVVSEDLKGHYMEEILPGPVGRSHPGYMGLDTLSSGQG